MIKKYTLLSVLLAIVLTLSLCSCAQTADKTEPAATETALTEASSASPAEAKASGTLPEQMTLEEKVGQLFYVRCPDVGAEAWIKRYHLGGLILFGRDFENKTAEEIQTDISGYQSAAKLGLLIGVDEEGGTVVRVSDNPNLRSEAFASPKDVYAAGGWQAIEQTESEKAWLLRSLGINVNMAPVCDVTGNDESFMFDRSFSGATDEVSEFVAKTVSIYSENRLGSVLKHFPGYGDNTDTHNGMAYDSKPYIDFQATDFPPFQAGISAGADCVLVAHNIIESMDSEQPASLSARVHQVLREELGFEGVIMTDDLEMGAITEYTGADASAVAAVKCGNDILCCTNVEEQYPAVLSAVQNGEISMEQIDASVKRILRWKQKLGLLAEDALIE